MLDVVLVLVRVFLLVVIASVTAVAIGCLVRFKPVVSVTVDVAVAVAVVGLNDPASVLVFTGSVESVGGSTRSENAVVQLAERSDFRAPATTPPPAWAEHASVARFKRQQ